MSDLFSMPTVTAEQINRFRDAAKAELEALEAEIAKLKADNDKLTLAIFDITEGVDEWEFSYDGSYGVEIFVDDIASRAIDYEYAQNLRGE